MGLIYMVTYSNTGLGQSWRVEMRVCASNTDQAISLGKEKFCSIDNLTNVVRIAPDWTKVRICCKLQLWATLKMWIKA